jgi:hypothetical protein
MRLLDPRLLGGCHWRIRGNTPQDQSHIAFSNAQNPALPLNGRANRSEACWKQALFRLAPGFKPGAVFPAFRGVYSLIRQRYPWRSRGSRASQKGQN